MMTTTENPLMIHFPDLEDYYKRGWIKGSELVAVLPALPPDHPKSQPYYASGRFSAVYMYINDDDYAGAEKSSSGRRFYLSDQEHFNMYMYVQKEKNHIGYQAPNFYQTLQNVLSRPVVLFFHGCDDGHVVLRFESREKAMDYLSNLTVFEDVFENSDIMFEN